MNRSLKEKMQARPEAFDASDVPVGRDLGAGYLDRVLPAHMKARLAAKANEGELRSAVAAASSPSLVDWVLAADQSLTRQRAKVLTQALVARLRQAAMQGEAVSIRDFGTFKVKTRPARLGRNPVTGEPIKIAARREVGFAPAKRLRDAINED